MPAPLSSAQRQRVVFLVSLILLPVVLFYGLLAHFALNVPVLDDYDAGLAYLNHTVALPNLHSRLVYLLAAQQNEYKIVFGHAIFWLQYSLFHHINFKLTFALGNLLWVAVGWILWKMFLPGEKDFVRRLALFLPVSLVIFQLNFAETLNWALPGLQNLGIPAFALACLYLLFRPGTLSFAGSIVMLILAIAASGNGFLLFPIGVLVLFRERRYAHLATWCAATILCILGYAFHFNSMSSQSPVHHSILQTLLHMRPIYALAFIGSSMPRPLFASFILGTALAGYLIWLTARGYWRRNPMIGCCVLFVLLTAVGVAGIRSDFGVSQAVSSRYRLYSDLLIAFAWIAFVEEILQSSSQRDAGLRRNRFFLLPLAAALLFFLAGEKWGVSFMLHNDRVLAQGMAQFEHPNPGLPMGPVLPVPNQTAAADAWDLQAHNWLEQSIQQGIYTPPNF